MGFVDMTGGTAAEVGLEDIALIVIGEDHPRRGQMGRVTGINSSKRDDYWAVKYPDGSTDSFRSGSDEIDLYSVGLSGGSHREAAADHKDGNGPECLARDCVEKYGHTVREF